MDRKKQLKEIKRRNSKAYNAMPESARIIAGRVIGEMRIYQLTREKARMKKAYDRNLREINSHIKSLEKILLKGDRFDDGKERRVEP